MIEADAPVDGRRARTERGRLAVTTAMIDLVFEGYAPPTTEQVAERAGVSIASLFRYYESLEDLRTAVLDEYFRRYDHLFDVAQLGEGELADRVDRFVAARVTLYETTAPMARLARRLAAGHPELEERLRVVRSTLADQVRRHFAAELSHLGPAGRDDAVVVMSTMTSFEAWDQMRHHHQRTEAQTRRAWAAALEAILTTVAR